MDAGFRFHNLPLVKERKGGERVQVCALTWQSAPESDWQVVLEGIGERQAHVVKEGSALRRLLLEIPAVKERRTLGVTVTDRRSGAVLMKQECPVDPVREWRVFVVHHSHLDIGYTHVQDHIVHLHTAFLDEAVQFADDTRDWPEDARFRWTIEAGYPLVEYCKRRSGSEVKRLVECIRRGQIELSAFSCNLHAETCSLEELARSLYETHEFAERWGFKIRSAMQSDVPGQPWSLPQLLAGCGVRYLSLAPNNHRAPVHAERKFDRPFYWKTRDGQKVLTWFTDHPVHVYQEGNVLGFIDSYESVLEKLPWKLLELESEGFPYDALHLRCQGSYADNGPPNITIAEVIRRWNDEWVWPKIRMALNWEFFEYMERRHGERIPVHEGDWPDWWADGTGSAAREMSLVRESHASLRTAGAMAAFVSLAESDVVRRDVSGCEIAGHQTAGPETAGLQTAERDVARSDEAASDPTESFGRVPLADRMSRRLREHQDELVQEMTLFDEHTWGAAQTEVDAWQGFGSQGRQWSLKSAHAHRAAAKGHAFEEAALGAFGRLISTGEHPKAVIFNSVAAPRRDVVTLELPRWLRIGDETRLWLRDCQTGEALPYEWIPKKTHDRAAVRFISPMTPGLGYSTVEIRRDGHEPARSHARRRREDAPITLENAFYRLRLDLEKAGAVSLVDRSTGAELLDASTLPLNGYIYDHYVKDDERTLNHRLILRHVPDRASLVGLEETPVESALVYQFRGGEGAEKVVCRLRLYDGVPALEVENAVHKTAVPHKEGGYFAFPFRAPREIYYNVPGGVYRLGDEQLPGALTDWLVVESGVYLPGERANVAWATVDAPLVEFGEVTTVQPPRPALKKNGHLYSYAFNNLWSTNFKPRQGGELRFRYRVTSRGVDDLTGFTHFAQAATHPLVAQVLPAGQEGRFREAASPLLEVEGEGVVVDSLVQARRGGVLVRLREVSGRSTSARLRFVLHGAARAGLVDPVERDIAEVPLSGGAATVALGANQMVHVRVE